MKGILRTLREPVPVSRLPRLFRPGGPGFCAGLMLAAGLCIQLFIPDSYFASPVPARADLRPEGFLLETTVRGAGGTVWKAFDGSFLGNCFHSDRGAAAGTVTITFPRPIAAARLRLAPQKDLLRRMPRDFELEGLDSGGGWKRLAGFSGIGTDRYKPSEFTDFPVNAGTAYKSYRLSVTANNGDSYLTFSELALEEREDARPDKFRLLLFCCACLAALCGARKAQAWLERRARSAGELSVKDAFFALALPPLTLFLLLPAQIYLGNSAEFLSRFSALFPAFLPAALLLCGALLAAFHRASGRGRTLLVSLAFTAGLLSWLQAVLWPWAGGELNGGRLGWELVGGTPLFQASAVRAYTQAALWLSGLGFALLAPVLVCRSAAVLALAALAAQSAALAFQAPRLPGLEAYKSEAANPANLFRFSSDRPNVVVIVLDMFQSDVFDEIRAGADSRYAAGLEGFVYFRNTVSGFPVTQGSVPELLTGKAFDNRRRLDEYMKEEFRANSLPKAAAAAGLTVAFRSWMPSTYYLDRGMVPDARSFEAGRLLEDLAQLYDLALFEASPDLLKPFIYSGGRWLLARLVVEMPYPGEHGTARLPGSTKSRDIKFVGKLLSDARAAPGAGAFKFYHLMGNHIPVDMDENLQARQMPFDRKGTVRQGKGVLVLLRKMLGELKRLGVYDNSLIFVLADHGSGLEVRSGLTSRASPAGWLARGLPLLLAKNAGARGPLRVTDAPAALQDVPFTIARRLGWAWAQSAEDLFDLAPGLQRRRRFTLANSLRDGKFGLFREYEIRGHAWEAASWRETGS